MTTTLGEVSLPTAADADRPVIEMHGVSKRYGQGEAEVFALRTIDLLVERGDYVAIMGASGSGKSTLMNIIGCLDTATTGAYLLDGADVRDLSEFELAEIRNRSLGFVFQSFNLIPRTRALPNVELPLLYAGMRRAERRRRALAALGAVGLSDRVDHLPSQLSGGQQQRVAIARALVTNPALLLADEPTGALDSRSTGEVLAIFDRLNELGRSIVVITHEREVADHARRVVTLRDGLIIGDVRNRPAPSAEREAIGVAAGSPVVTQPAPTGSRLAALSGYPTAPPLDPNGPTIPWERAQ
jgi:putative ABC transport system ATP-binding protein